MRTKVAILKYCILLSLGSMFAFQYSCEKDPDPETESKLGTLTDYDGNIYSTIQIGEQWWMVNNLKTTHYADGTEILLVESITVWEALGIEDQAYCFYNNSTNNEEANFGALYTWAAASNGSTGSDNNPSGIQGVCPDGWHLPSDSEWKELEIFLGMAPDTADAYGYRGYGIGSKLASSPDGWVDGYLDGHPAFGTSGFNAKPGGGRRYDGTFDHKGDNANFWTATEYGSQHAWGRHIYSAYSTVHRYRNVKSDGFSVRCVKDPV